MSVDIIVRAWKEPQLRAELSAGQLEAMPPHPSGEGLGELTKAELGGTDVRFGAVGGGLFFTFSLECPYSIRACC